MIFYFRFSSFFFFSVCRQLAKSPRFYGWRVEGRGTTASTVTWEGNCKCQSFVDKTQPYDGCKDEFNRDFVFTLQVYAVRLQSLKRRYRVTSRKQQRRLRRYCAKT